MEVLGLAKSCFDHEGVVVNEIRGCKERIQRDVRGSNAEKERCVCLVIVPLGRVALMACFRFVLWSWMSP